MANKHKCNICDQRVNLDNLHPNSLPVPSPASGDQYTVAHMGCANNEDRFTHTDPNFTEDDFTDSRAWVTVR